MTIIEIAKQVYGTQYTEQDLRFAALVRDEALDEAAEWCEAKQSYSAIHANTEFAAGIRGLK